MRAASTARFSSNPTAIRELGVGINTLPHAIKELARARPARALDQVGIRTHELFYINRIGQEIWREPRGTDAGYDVPQFSIHRGRLQGVIHQRRASGSANARSVPATASAPSRRTTAASRPISSIATARIAHTARGDVLIGADGIHSMCAKRFTRTKARRAGTARCSGAAPRLAGVPDRALDDHRRRDGGEARRLPDRGRRRPAAPLTNWAVWRRSATAAAPPPRGRLVAPGPLRGSDAACRALHGPARRRVGLIAATPEVYEYPMCDRDPLPRWSHGRVTLLGDAAHPMYPVGSNGASPGDPRRRASPSGSPSPTIPRQRCGATRGSGCQTARSCGRTARAGRRASSTRSSSARERLRISRGLYPADSAFSACSAVNDFLRDSHCHSSSSRSDDAGPFTTLPYASNLDP